MERQKDNQLRERIIAEMTVEYAGALEKNFDLAKQFIRITRDGRVDLLLKDRLPGKEQILLYLIGKLYAKEAGFATTDDVGNQELMDELGILKGSLLPWLKDLRDSNQIERIRRGRYSYHTIPVSLVERTLAAIDGKLKGST